MSRLFQLAVKTHEARISENGDGYRRSNEVREDAR